MQTGFDFSQFRRKVSATAGELLQQSEAYSAVAAEVWDLADRALAASEADLSLVACKAGCGSCCILKVDLLPPEAEAIMSRLEQTLTTDQLAALAERAKGLIGDVGDQRLVQSRPCLFLSPQQNCTIHPSRPLLCRAVTAIDPEQCRTAVAKAAVGETYPVMANLFQQQLYHEAFCGLAEALENAGHPGESTTLVEAVHLGLKNRRRGGEL